MSLINKMLSDLEQRHSQERDQDQIVLGGLAPVANTGFATPRLPYNFLLVSFFTIALLVALYGYWQGSSSPTQQTGTLAQMEKVDPGAETLNNVEGNKAIAGLPALKLDLSLPVTAPPHVIPATVNAGITAVSTSLQDNITSLQLRLDNSAAYRVRAEENPYRMVLEIDNASLQAAVPVMSGHPYIDELQISTTNGRDFVLVAAASEPVKVVSAAMTAEDSTYVLSISLRSAFIETVELLPTTEQVLTAAESGYGQMEIRPVTAGMDEPFQRLLVEARKAYASQDYTRADSNMLAILQQEPLNVEARTVYASSLVSRGHAGSAMQVLAAGLDMNPGVTDWAIVYARLLVEQAKIAEAVSVLRRSLPQLDNNPDYYAFYAALLQRLNRHDEAVNYYRELLARQPDNGVWWLGMGISQEGMQNSEDALSSYNRALQTPSLNNDLRQYVSRQIERLGR